MIFVDVERMEVSKVSNNWDAIRGKGGMLQLGGGGLCATI